MSGYRSTAYTKIGKLFGASVIVSIYAHHGHIVISPKEEELFMKLMALENKLKEQGLKEVKELVK